MSWFEPPPQVEKPPHPWLHLPKPSRYRLIYGLGLFFWLCVLHVVWFLLQFLPFFRAHFWIGEWITVAVGLIIGHWTSTLILISLARQTNPQTLQPKNS